MEAVTKFLESSSIGGLSYISTSKSRAEKLFWFVVVITSISVTSYLTTEAILNWSNYPVATTTESFPISEVHFPKITVCPPKVAFSFTQRIFRQHDATKYGFGCYEFFNLKYVLCACVQKRATWVV